MDLATVSERMVHSNVRTTAEIYAHAIRGKAQAAAQVWDDLMQQSWREKLTGVNSSRSSQVALFERVRY